MDEWRCPKYGYVTMSKDGTAVRILEYEPVFGNSPPNVGKLNLRLVPDLSLHSEA